MGVKNKLFAGEKNNCQKPGTLQENYKRVDGITKVNIDSN